MEKVTRTLKSFAEILEMIRAIYRRGSNRIVYLENEVVAAANERNTLFIVEKISEDESILRTLKLDEEINFVPTDNPDGEYHLRLEVIWEY